MPRRRTKPSWQKLCQEVANAKDINDLSTEGLVLFNFLTQIVDIKYRKRYGEALEWENGKGYSKPMRNEANNER
jgi:hypothetical protein